MYEECNGAEKYYFYDSNGIISGIRYFDANGNMTMIYVVTNSQGDVIALYDKNGNAVVEYQYDAWGNIISVVNSTEGSSLDWNEVNPFRYRGYYYDAETGLYYLQSRYYDAEVGRFINQDSYVSTGTGLLGYNMFAYCDNNPVNGWDPTGEKTFECCPHGDCRYCKEKEKAKKIEAKVNIYTPDAGKKQQNMINVSINRNHEKSVFGIKYKDPNIRIYNSFLITNESEIRAVIRCIMESSYYDESVFTRSEESYFKEWHMHNVAYYKLTEMKSKGFNVSKLIDSAKDVDLNEKSSEFFWDTAYSLGGRK